MTELQQIALITGIFTIAGVILGGLIPFIIELFRRIWKVSDRKYDRKKEVLDRRCDQAEAYTQAATEDFRRVMNDIDFYLFDPEGAHVIELAEERIQNKLHLDTKVFALGPSILALNDKNLLTAWDKMMDAMDKLKDSFLESGKYRFEGDSSIDPVKLHSKVQEIWIDYSKQLDKFYICLDKIRNTNLEQV